MNNLQNLLELLFFLSDEWIINNNPASFYTENQGIYK